MRPRHKEVKGHAFTATSFMGLNLCGICKSPVHKAMQCNGVCVPPHLLSMARVVIVVGSFPSSPAPRLFRVPHA